MSARRLKCKHVHLLSAASIWHKRFTTVDCTTHKDRQTLWTAPISEIGKIVDYAMLEFLLISSSSFFREMGIADTDINVPFPRDWEISNVLVIKPSSQNTYFFSSSFLQLFCPNGISPIGNWGCLPRGKASCDRVALLNLRCMLGVLVFP